MTTERVQISVQRNSVKYINEESKLHRKQTATNTL